MGLRKKPPLQKPMNDTDKRKAETLEKRTVLVHGEEQEILVPPSSITPTEIQWDTQKLKTAELIADGVPLLQISKMPGMPSRMSIYGWMRHPEFKSYVEELVIETGLANRIERIAATKRVMGKLADKFEEQLDKVDLTDKNAASLIKTFLDGMKQVNEEVRGYDQLIKMETDQKVEAKVTTLDIDQLMQNSPDDIRAKLQEEFAKQADAIIRGIGE